MTGAAAPPAGSAMLAELSEREATGDIATIFKAADDSDLLKSLLHAAFTNHSASFSRSSVGSLRADAD